MRGFLKPIRMRGPFEQASRRVVADTISGTAYPGETLTASGGSGPRDWQVDGVSTGETGSTYVVSIYDIGKPIKCVTGGLDSNVLTCWHPSDVAEVAACWLPWLNVYNSVSPDVEAEVGETIRRWDDAIAAIDVSQATGAQQPIKRDGFIESDGVNDIMSVAAGGLGLFRNIGSGRIIFAGRDRSPTTGNATHLAAYWSIGSNNAAVRISLLTAISGNATFAAQARQQDANPTASSATVAGDDDYHVLEAFGDFANGFVRLVVDGVTVASAALAGAGNTTDSDSAGAALFSRGANYAPLDNFATLVLDGEPSASDLSRVRRFAMLCMGDNYEGPDIPLVSP